MKYDVVARKAYNYDLEIFRLFPIVVLVLAS